MIHIDVNLDDLASPEEAEEASRVLTALALYADLHGRSMRERLKGRLNESVRQQSEADKVYEGLPDWVKWA